MRRALEATVEADTASAAAASARSAAALAAAEYPAAAAVAAMDGGGVWCSAQRRLVSQNVAHANGVQKVAACTAPTACVLDACNLLLCAVKLRCELTTKHAVSYKAAEVHLKVCGGAVRSYVHMLDCSLQRGPLAAQHGVGVALA